MWQVISFLSMWLNEMMAVTKRHTCEQPFVTDLVGLILLYFVLFLPPFCDVNDVNSYYPVVKHHIVASGRSLVEWMTRLIYLRSKDF